MSTTAPVVPRTRTGRRPGAVAALLISVGVAVVLNLVVLAVLAATGADLSVTVPGGPGTLTIDAVAVVAATAGPLLIAGLIAAAVVRRVPSLRRWAAWAGLALALVSVIAPLTLQAEAATRAGLAVMHVVAGIAWFVALTAADRAAPAPRPAADPPPQGAP